jgi:hypothetical protein
MGDCHPFGFAAGFNLALVGNNLTDFERMRVQND